jgi:low affinity Fe/Cu permease
VYAFVLAGRVPIVERIYWNPVKRREHAANVVAIGHKSAQRREKRLDKLARLTRKAGQQAVVRTKTAVKQALGATGLMRS